MVRKKAAPAKKKATAKKPPTTPRIALAADDRPPRGLTRELFLAWRAPRLGTANPERMTNPVWSWLARRSGVNAWMANRHFKGPSSFGGEPGWCNQRFGQSRTGLADGRTLLIAGEHEDHYDPDFFIYNDVIVVSADGGVEVYGYPREVFPPTDFHTATRVGERVLLIGCLGYPEQRRPGVTPVFALDTDTLAVSPVATTGDAPGWVFRHAAEMSGDGRTITVRGGERDEEAGGERVLRESIDDWSLDLERMAWTRLTDRQWPLWELRRAEGGINQLMTIGWMSWHVGGRTDFDREQLTTMQEQLGWFPDFAVYAERYAPPIEHATLPEREDEVSTTRIVVEGVTVRYDEGYDAVRITVEGALSERAMEALVEDARRKLATLERTTYEARRLR